MAWLYPDLSVAQVIERWLALGARLAVLTLGAKGATAATAATAVNVDAPSVVVRDTVGAGDSFMSGLIAALDRRELLTVSGRTRLPHLDEETLHAIVAFGVQCSAVTVTREGADPPRWDEFGPA